MFGFPKVTSDYMERLLVTGVPQCFLLVLARQRESIFLCHGLFPSFRLSFVGFCTVVGFKSLQLCFATCFGFDRRFFSVYDSALF